MHQGWDLKDIISHGQPWDSHIRCWASSHIRGKMEGVNFLLWILLKDSRWRGSLGLPKVVEIIVTWSLKENRIHQETYKVLLVYGSNLQGIPKGDLSWNGWDWGLNLFCCNFHRHQHWMRKKKVMNGRKLRIMLDTMAKRQSLVFYREILLMFCKTLKPKTLFQISNSKSSSNFGFPF